MNIQKAYIAGGCFWCLDGIYRMIKGVHNVHSGYAGGHVPSPTYEEVSSGNTGHAETVEIEFDPSIVTYTDILEVFFAIHDPTTPNRQGNDVGTQYRSAIFYVNDEQKKIAETVLNDVNSAEHYDGAVVTELKPLDVFYPAENYHQNYYELNKDKNPYCSFVISPKIKKFKEKFASLLKP